MLRPPFRGIVSRTFATKRKGRGGGRGRSGGGVSGGGRKKKGGRQDDAFRAGAIAIKQVAGKGRGVVAQQPLRKGTLLLAETPLASHPGLLQDRCQHCTRPLAISGISHVCKHTGAQFCSGYCKNSAWRGYGRALVSADTSELTVYCAEHRLKFPLLALRMVGASLHRGFSDYWETVEELCFATVEGEGSDGVPAAWREEHALLRGALVGHVKGDVGVLFEHALTEEWYARLMGRLHLNAVRVYSAREQRSPRAAQKQAENAAAAAVEAAPLAMEAHGTALYLLGSMFNHSCAANTAVNFPSADHCAQWVAARDVEAGEELCISYIAAEQGGMSYEQRQRSLRFSHGFFCGCELCTAQEQALGTAALADMLE